MKIQYLKHNQINKKQWDAAIENSHNGLVYALSWYLDIVSTGWNALVIGDYEAVMPLTHRNKFGIKYLYQPVFVQKLGLFSVNKIESEITDYSLKEALKYYKFIDVFIDNSPKSFPSKERKTQMLDLSKSYPELYSNYSKNHQKNIEKALNSGLSLKQEGNPEDFILLLQRMYDDKNLKDVSQKDIANLRQIVHYAVSHDLGVVYFGYTDNRFCAASFFLKWKDRSVIFTAQNNKGREIGAMFSIIDYYIQNNASKKLVLDFAGSTLPGVAKRNRGFGAKNSVYYDIRINNLPWPLKYLKR